MAEEKNTKVKTSVKVETSKQVKKIEQKKPEQKKEEKKNKPKLQSNFKPSGFFGLRKKKEPSKNEEMKPVLIRDAYEVLKFVLMTEKAVRQIELQNKLVFIVDRKSKKPEIKAAAQAAFNTAISGVTTMIDQTGRKKAFIKFKEPGTAGDIAVRLGII